MFPWNFWCIPIRWWLFSITQPAMGHAIILVPWQSLQLIWRLDTSKFHLWMPDSVLDEWSSNAIQRLVLKIGYQDSSPSNGCQDHQPHCQWWLKSRMPYAATAYDHRYSIFRFILKSQFDLINYEITWIYPVYLQWRYNGFSTNHRLVLKPLYLHCKDTGGKAVFILAFLHQYQIIMCLQVEGWYVIHTISC